MTVLTYVAPTALWGSYDAWNGSMLNLKKENQWMKKVIRQDGPFPWEGGPCDQLWWSARASICHASRFGILGIGLCFGALAGPLMFPFHLASKVKGNGVQNNSN